MLNANTPDFARIHEFYDPVEICFLCDYLRIPRPDQLASISLKVGPDDRQGQSDDGFVRPVLGAGGSDTLIIENAVARLALNAIEERLPRWFGRNAAGEQVSSRRPKHARHTTTPLEPSYLFGINWASTGPGLDWPEHYHVAYFPGFEVLVVTASQDSTDVHGYLDQAIGWFPASANFEDSVETIISGWWQSQASCLQEHWEALLGEGLIDAGRAICWADAVWCSDDEDEEWID